MVVEAYAPFLDTICDMFKELGRGKFEDFLDECGIYSFHKEILSSYFHTGLCTRNEPMLPNEVMYEKKRMTEGIANLLIKLGEIRPIFLVINRFNLVSQSSIDVVLYLLEHPSSNIGIVLGSNDSPWIKGEALEHWNTMLEVLGNYNQIYHLGSTGKERLSRSVKLKNRMDKLPKTFATLKNCYYLLEFEYIEYHFNNLERQAMEEEIAIEPRWLAKLCQLYAKVSIMTQNFSKAIETLSRLKKLDSGSNNTELSFECALLTANCYMYLGRLDIAEKYAALLEEIAQSSGEEKKIFQAKLLKVQIQMSGWHNIFFCISDIKIEDDLIEMLKKYEYKNNLAHIYIYAYDNNPQVVAKACESESALKYFSKGVELAKEIDNEILVFNAFQKNIMIASTFGMNEIALLYTVRTYQYIKGDDTFNRAKTYVGIGYNLCALGHNKLATDYYNRALELFYELRRTEDIAEVNYNIALNYIMMEEFDKAENRLNETMKTVERLRLNSIRVCNLSKLYALLAVVSILQGHRFDCERNLQNCKQFLNYMLMKIEKDGKSDVIHDYAKCDDDMFLYTYAVGLINFYDGDREKALENFQEAEIYLYKAEGNQFYIYECFRKSRMLIFDSMNMSEEYAKEELLLEQHKKKLQQKSKTVSLKILESISSGVHSGPCEVSKAEMELLLKQAGTERDYQICKRQMRFMAILQSIIDVSDGNEENMIYDAMFSFLTYFDNDKAMFIRYSDDSPSVLFNNTDVELNIHQLMDIYDSMDSYPNGYAVSKISENYFDHESDIALFGIEEVCSFVAVPCYDEGRVQAILITYILMKENWHNSVNRYMLDDEDLNFYRLIFKELNASINLTRLNKILEESAHFDALTGVYNRVGMYREAERLVKKVQHQDNDTISVMFLDVDNFKPYNDTFGHDVGDNVLREMAKIFKNAVGEDGFVSRYGGDEFIIILNSDERSRLESLAREILDRVINHPVFSSYTDEIHDMKPLSCSIGITTHRASENISVDEMIKQADDLMYKVKSTSKGTYTFL